MGQRITADTDYHISIHSVFLFIPSFGSSFNNAACKPSFRYQRFSIDASIFRSMVLVFSDGDSVSSSMCSLELYAEELWVAPVSASRLRTASSKLDEDSSTKKLRNI